MTVNQWKAAANTQPFGSSTACPLLLSTGMDLSSSPAVLIEVQAQMVQSYWWFHAAKVVLAA